MSDSDTDVRSIRWRTFACEAAAAETGPVTLVTADDTMPSRLMSAGDYRRAGEGFEVRWRDSIGTVYWMLDADQVQRKLADAAMYGRDTGPVSRGQAERVHAGLVAALVAREEADTAHVPVSTLSVTGAVASRLCARRDVWREGDELWWRRRGAAAAPEPPPTGNTLLARMVGRGLAAVPGAELCTVATVREAVEVGGYLVRGEHIETWDELHTEVAAYAGTRP